MKTVLITTADDPLNIFFWKSFLEYKEKSISKIIILPSRDEIDFPFLMKPFIALRMLGVLGILKFVHTKIFLRKIKFNMVSEECVFLNSLDLEVLYSEVSQGEVDVLISVGAPVVFDDDLLSLSSICALNIHNGDIKKYRGHFSSFWEIMNKEKESAVTLHEMKRKVDSGAIYDQSFINRLTVSSFWDLMVWKKTKGGEMLAKNLHILEEKKILDEFEVEGRELSESVYYGFPRVADVLRFRFN